jgi:malic enzyme
MATAPSASYSFTVRLQITNRPGMLGRAPLAIGKAGGDINVLCFPGFFRGLLDSRAQTVNDEMKLAAARALAACVDRSELSEESIIPSVFNKSVAPAVAGGVARAAAETGTARRRRRFELSGIR